MALPTAPTSYRHQNTKGTHNDRSTQAFTSLTVLTSLAIFLQAVLAGQFIDRQGRGGWIDAHGAVADVSWVLALAAATVAWRILRHSHRTLWLGSAALFVLDLTQTGIGHLITDEGQDGLIMLHVPLAFVLFGLTIWLSLRAGQLRRRRP
jgi:hypothetical protein